jgi:hypothetical protein
VTTDPLSALLAVVAILEDLGIEYAVGGSVASSIHGEPRASADADLLVRLSCEQLAALLSRLDGPFYVSEDAARDAWRRHGSFNAIHLASMYKIDLFVAGPSSLDRDQLDRRTRVELTDHPASSAYVTAAENVVLRKLDWFRQSGETSDRQWRDVLGVLKVQADLLDLAYLRNAANESGLSDLLDRALRESGTHEP